MAAEALAPAAGLLTAGLLLDALIGDPQFRYHPIRLIGRTLSTAEAVLRRWRWDGYGGGCILFLYLAIVWVVLPSLLVARVGSLLHILVVYIFFALRNLIDHVRNVRRTAAGGDLPAARQAIGLLVGRDTDRMDATACRRAAIESLSENFVDGFLSPLFWYAVLGIPGLLLFKVVSTMDSMVGYKTRQYLRFGWCGARLDDVMNFIPARLSWLILAVSGAAFPRLSATKGLRIGLDQHAILPGPNPGWSEATMAGLLQRRLIGPIWRDGVLVTKLWLGDTNDPEGGSDDDVNSAVGVTIAAAVTSTIVAVICIHLMGSSS
jgi:adenosylcobinamide-phosphate synthase